MSYYTSLNTPVGILYLFSYDHALHRISFPSDTHRDKFSASDPAPKNHPLLNRAKVELTEYFDDGRKQFDLPLSAKGTAFQQTVWQYILRIPYGETRTYGEIAVALGNPNKARAVGGAANKNPLPIVIPCHRVVGSSGQLTGFAGGLATKHFLLDLETKKSSANLTLTPE